MFETEQFTLFMKIDESRGFIRNFIINRISSVNKLRISCEANRFILWKLLKVKRQVGCIKGNLKTGKFANLPCAIITTYIKNYSPNCCALYFFYKTCSNVKKIPFFLRFINAQVNTNHFTKFISQRKEL